MADILFHVHRRKVWKLAPRTCRLTISESLVDVQTGLFRSGFEFVISAISSQRIMPKVAVAAIFVCLLHHVFVRSCIIIFPTVKAFRISPDFFLVSQKCQIPSILYFVVGKVCKEILPLLSNFIVSRSVQLGLGNLG